MIIRIALFYICITATALAQTAEEQATALFTEMATLPSVPGINVAIGDQNGIIWAKGFGYANLEYKTPMVPGTLMRIGSVAKVITTAAMMRMVERGELDLDVPIRTYVPQWPEKHPSINLRQLAAHVAGIRHYRDNEFLANKTYTDSIHALEIFKDDDLLFEPGTEYSYSTYAWTLISAAMENVSGKDFKTIIREEVLEPLDLKNTIFDDNKPIIKNRQSAYDFNDGVLENSPEVNASYKYAGGGFLASPIDVVNFALAHTKSGYLKPETLKEMFTILPPSYHGIGWVVGFDRYMDNYSEEFQNIMRDHPNTVMHSGGSVGGLTMMILCLDHNRAVALTKNVSGGPGANHFELALKTLDIFHKSQ